MSYDEVSEPMRRTLWLQEFEVDYEEVLGEGWPLVIVTKWERNLMGERRYVGARIYRPVEEPLADPISAT